MEKTFSNSKVVKILLPILPIVVLYIFNHQNIVFGFSMILGAIVLPYVIKISPRAGGIRYAIPAAIMGILMLFFRQSSFFWFMSVFMLLFVVDNWWGRINYLPILLVTAISPLLRKLVDMWSFPIRLELSSLAGKALRACNFDIETSGNMLILDGNTFSVDPACIGLRMVIVSLVLAILFLAFFEKKHNYSLPFWKTGLLLCLVLIASVVSNFVRLLALIIFHILPENPLHDAIGIASLFLYVLLPFYFLLNFYFQKRKIILTEKTILSEKKKAIAPSVFSKTILIALFALQLYNAPKFLVTPVDNINAIQDISIPGFEREITPFGVLKLENQEALIYIKPPVRFFQGGHDPRICWQGSGYEFSEIKIETIGEKAVYSAILTKGEDKIYSVWWFENSEMQTPHDKDWRWQNFLGSDDFYLININCSEKNTIQKLLTQRNPKLIPTFPKN